MDSLMAGYWAYSTGKGSLTVVHLAEMMAAMSASAKPKDSQTAGYWEQCLWKATPKEWMRAESI